MAQTKVHIRQLTIADYDSLIDLWQRAGLHSLRPHGRDSRDAIEQQLATGIQTILGTELDGCLIGVVVTTHDSRKGWINRLAIAPEHRRQGHGTELINVAEARLREQGTTVIATLVESDNDPSYELFKKTGYTEFDAGIHYMTKRGSDAA